MEELIEIKKATEELLSEKKWAQARDLFRELPAPDIADSLPGLEVDGRPGPGNGAGMSSES